MFLKQLSIRRDTRYSFSEPKGDEPFAATIELIGQHGKVERRLDADLSRRILEIVSDEVAKAGRATAEAMVAEVLSGQPLLAAE